MENIMIVFGGIGIAVLYGIIKKSIEKRGKRVNEVVRIGIQFLALISAIVGAGIMLLVEDTTWGFPLIVVALILLFAEWATRPIAIRTKK